jgi:hypothetical protein
MPGPAKPKPKRRDPKLIAAAWRAALNGMVERGKG